MVMDIRKEPVYGIIKETGVLKESKFGIIKETESSDNQTRGGAESSTNEGIFTLYCRQIHLIADLTLSAVCATAREGERGSGRGGGGELCHGVDRWRINMLNVLFICMTLSFVTSFCLTLSK